MALPNPITESGDLTAQRANLLTSRAVRLRAQAASQDPQVATEARANIQRISGRFPGFMDRAPVSTTPSAISIATTPPEQVVPTAPTPQAPAIEEDTGPSPEYQAFLDQYEPHRLSLVEGVESATKVANDTQAQLDTYRAALASAGSALTADQKAGYESSIANLQAGVNSYRESAAKSDAQLQEYVRWMGNELAKIPSSPAYGNVPQSSLPTSVQSAASLRIIKGVGTKTDYQTQLDKAIAENRISPLVIVSEVGGKFVYTMPSYNDLQGQSSITNAQLARLRIGNPALYDKVTKDPANWKTHILDVAETLGVSTAKFAMPEGGLSWTQEDKNALKVSNPALYKQLMADPVKTWGLHADKIVSILNMARSPINREAALSQLEKIPGVVVTDDKGKKNYDLSAALAAGYNSQTLVYLFGESAVTGILKDYPNYPVQLKQKQDYVDSLVKEGVLTAKDLKALGNLTTITSEKLQPYIDRYNTQQQRNVINDLVAQGVLTRADLAAIGDLKNVTQETLQPYIDAYNERQETDQANWARVLSPYKVGDGYDLTAALEGGVTPSGLIRAGFLSVDIDKAIEAIEPAKASRIDAQTWARILEPYKTEGGYDIAAALVGGVTRTGLINAGFDAKTVDQAVASYQLQKEAQTPLKNYIDPRTQELNLTGAITAGVTVQQMKAAGYDVSQERYNEIKLPFAIPSPLPETKDGGFTDIPVIAPPGSITSSVNKYTIGPATVGRPSPLDKLGLWWMGVTPWKEEKGETLGSMVKDWWSTPSGLSGQVVLPSIGRMAIQPDGTVIAYDTRVVGQEKVIKVFKNIDEATTYRKAAESLSPQDRLKAIIGVTQTPEFTLATAGLGAAGGLSYLAGGISRIPILGIIASKAPGYVLKPALVTTTASGAYAIGRGIFIPPTAIDIKQYSIDKTKVGTLKSVEGFTTPVIGKPDYFNIQAEALTMRYGETEAIRRLAEAGLKPTIDKRIWNRLDKATQAYYIPTVSAGLETEPGIIGAYGRGAKEQAEFFQELREGKPWYSPGALAAGIGTYYAPHALVSELYPTKGVSAATTLIPHFGPTIAYTGLTWKEQSAIGKIAGIGFGVLPYATGPIGQLTGAFGRTLGRIPGARTIGSVISFPFKVADVATFGLTKPALATVERYSPYQFAYSVGKVVPVYGKYATAKGWLGSTVPLKEVYSQWGERAPIGTKTAATELQESKIAQAKTRNEWLETEVAAGRMKPIIDTQGKIVSYEEIIKPSRVVTPAERLAQKIKAKAMTASFEKAQALQREAVIAGNWRGSVRIGKSGLFEYFPPSLEARIQGSNVPARKGSIYQPSSIPRQASIFFKQVIPKAALVGTAGVIAAISPVAIMTPAFISQINIDTANQMLAKNQITQQQHNQIVAQLIQLQEQQLTQQEQKQWQQLTQEQQQRIQAKQVRLAQQEIQRIVQAQLPQTKWEKFNQQQQNAIVATQQQAEQVQVQQAQQQVIQQQQVQQTEQQIQVAQTQLDNLQQQRASVGQIRMQKQVINQLQMQLQQQVQLQQTQQQVQQQIRQQDQGREKVPVTRFVPPVPLPIKWPQFGGGGGGGGIARHGARSSYVQYGIIPEMYVALPTFRGLKPEGLGKKSWDKIIRQPEGLELLGEESEEPVQTAWGPKYVRKVAARVRLKVGATEKQRETIGLTIPEEFYAGKVITKTRPVSKKINKKYTAYEILPEEDIGVQSWVG